MTHATTAGNKPDKRALFRSLWAVEVFLVDRLVQRWTVRLVDGTEVSGRPNARQIQITNEGGKCSIYITIAHGDTIEPTPEEVEEALKLFNFKVKDPIPFLQALMRPDISSLEAMFASNGLRLETFEDATSMREDEQDPKVEEVDKPNQMPALSTTIKGRMERGAGLPDELTASSLEEEGSLIFADSGYGSASKAATAASKWGSNQERSDDDNASVTTSNLSLDLPPASASAYVDAFVKRILESIADFQPDEMPHSQIIQVLPLLLRRFALRISVEDESADGRAVGLFTRKNTK